VTPDQLNALLVMAPSGPVHIHIAEQTGEVDACVAWSGQRPVAWLLDHMPVDLRWCFVHATHADTVELAAMARSGSVVGLCPITEANLGDGIFPADEFLSAAGRVGIGSDSNVLIDAAEELRLLEYGQRLMRQRRNVLTTPGLSTGRSLFDAAYAGGSQALGVEPTGLRIGAPADLVVLAQDDLPPVGDDAIDRWLFARGNRGVDSVWRSGRCVVTGGRHIARDRIAERYRTVMRRLYGVTPTRMV
jgi:formiminoglutamate deiminase